jgi:hypothetical protein
MKGNRTNHPGRAGVTIKSHKGGRTAALYMTITPDALAKLKVIASYWKQSRSDYLEAKIEEDYSNLVQSGAIPASAVV